MFFNEQLVVAVLGVTLPGCSADPAKGKMPPSGNNGHVTRNKKKVTAPFNFLPMWPREAQALSSPALACFSIPKPKARKSRGKLAERFLGGKLSICSDQQEVYLDEA